MDKDYVCEDYGTEKHWTRIRVTVPLARLDDLTSIMSMISNNLQIEDYSDIDLKTCYGDLIDETVAERVKVDYEGGEVNGVIVEGSSALNTAALTGESVPRSVAAATAMTRAQETRE